MLKKFLISMLGAVAGVWIAVTIAIFSCFALIGALVGSESVDKTNIEKKSALYLNLKGSLPERYQPAGLLQMLRETETGGDALVDILDAVRLAANDAKIEGIYINSTGAGLGGGIAGHEEIVSALKDFKKSGKWIVAYGDTYTQGDYLLASVADSVILNPMGAVDIHGMASQTPFFTGLMEKLGIKMQILRVGTYKSAVEPYMTTEMSPASEYQTRVMLDSIWDYATSVISDNRAVSVAQINMWADSMISTWPAQEINSASAVTSLMYRRKAEDVVRKLCGLDEEDALRLVTPTDYIAAAGNRDHSGSKHIAVYFACGDIVDAGDGGIVGPKVVDDIIALADDDKVSALVLRVNSGGGSAYASDQIWEALEYFKSKNKKFYVSMGDYAASGGYYISCGADKIYADRTTLTGSIGVFGMIPDVSGLVSGKLGVNFQTVATNPAGMMTAPFGELTPTQRAAMQRSVEDIYEVFTGRVAAGRHMEQDSVKLIAEGRVWTGGAALGLGLVDEIGGLRAAILDIASEAGVAADKVVYYPDVDGNVLAELLSKARSTSVSINGLTISEETMQAMKVMQYLRDAARVQARMEPLEIQF